MYVPECAKHTNMYHHEHDVQFKKEFDWVLLQPGMGHIEMNAVKGLVELSWEVFWKRLAMTMNFRSETALMYCRKSK